MRRRSKKELASSSNAEAADSEYMDGNSKKSMHGVPSTWCPGGKHCTQLELALQFQYAPWLAKCNSKLCFATLMQMVRHFAACSFDGISPCCATLFATAEH